VVRPLKNSASGLDAETPQGHAGRAEAPSADPLPVLLFVRLAEAAGFPAESFAVATLPGSDRLVLDDRMSVISFTGSSETGRRILARAGIKQFVMELGGGDPAIVLADADLELAAERVAAGVYSYSGQRRDAVKLVLVERPVYWEFTERLVRELSKVVVGDPRSPETVMGPLIDERAVEDMLSAVEEAVRMGGRVLYGGRRLGPTLVEVRDKGALRGMRLYREEVFAPVAVVTDFQSEDEAVEIVNGRRYGLDAAVFGRDLERIWRLVRLLEFGAVYVNDMPRHGTGYYPFGSRKDSGIGREGVAYAVEHVSAYKTIMFNFKGRGVWSYAEY